MSTSPTQAIWYPNPGPQMNAFLCECEEVMFGGGRGCVHPDTLLDTPDGPCPISKWRGGEIYSYKDGERITTYATPSVEGTEEDLYQVEIANGRKVICTDEHKFMTFDGWKMLKELGVMDPYVLSTNPDVETVTHFYRVLNVVKVGREKYWDLHVPETNCYFAQGILHHNSGKSSLLFGKVTSTSSRNSKVMNTP